MARSAQPHRSIGIRTRAARRGQARARRAPDSRFRVATRYITDTGYNAPARGAPRPAEAAFSRVAGSQDRVDLHGQVRRPQVVDHLVHAVIRRGVDTLEETQALAL